MPGDKPRLSVWGVVSDCSLDPRILELLRAYQDGVQIFMYLIPHSHSLCYQFG